MRRAVLRIVSPLVGCVAAVATSACDGPKAELAAPKRPVANPEKVAEIFTADLWGKQISHLETIIGPAIRVSDGWREYDLGQCAFELAANEGAVTALSIKASNRCEIDLGPFLRNQDIPPLDAMTIGQFADSVGGVAYGANCLGLACGNSTPSAVYAWWKGSNANGNIQVILEAERQGDKNVAGIKAWTDDLYERRTEEWIHKGTYNCDADEKFAAHPSLDAVRVAWVIIGHDLQFPDDSCPANQRVAGPQWLDRGVQWAMREPPESKTAGSGESLSRAESTDTDARWFILAQPHQACIPVSDFDYNTWTPADVMASLRRNGIHVEWRSQSADMAIIRSPDNRLIMAFVKGETKCRLSLALLGSG